MNATMPDAATWTSWMLFDDRPKLVHLEVNTNDVEVTFEIQADGKTVLTKTVKSRGEIPYSFEVPPGVDRRRWRIYADPYQPAIREQGGRFQVLNQESSIFRFNDYEKEYAHHTWAIDREDGGV
jgi:hypothetical protein